MYSFFHRLRSNPGLRLVFGFYVTLVFLNQFPHICVCMSIYVYLEIIYVRLCIHILYYWEMIIVVGCIGIKMMGLIMARGDGPGGSGSPRPSLAKLGLGAQYLS